MSTTIDKRAVSDVRDFLASIPQAWASFSKKLSAVLSKLEMDQYLIISAKDSNRFVQFASEGEAGTRVEVTSNYFLKGRDRLNRRQILWLRTNGWNAPTGDVNEATPEKDPKGVAQLLRRPSGIRCRQRYRTVGDCRLSSRMGNSKLSITGLRGFWA
jgi:hypothetical protein